MEHCKKLVLVPHETISRFHEKPVTRSAENVMNDLDREMNNILKQKAEDSEKWKLYEQALQKYLYFVNEQKKPSTLILPSDDTPNKADVGNAFLQNIKEKLISITPTKFKTSASYLYDHLSTPEARKLISWDESGKTSVGGETLPSIIDLISDVVRTRKTEQIKEWEKFANVLKTLHTPLTIIGNKKYSNFIQNQDGSGIRRCDAENTKTSNIHCPAKTIKRKTVKQKKPAKRLETKNWRRWTR